MTLESRDLPIKTLSFTLIASDELDNGSEGRGPVDVRRHYQRLEEDRVQLYFRILYCFR